MFESKVPQKKNIAKATFLTAAFVVVGLLSISASPLSLVPVLMLLSTLLALALIYFVAYARRREREAEMSRMFLETILGQLPVALFCKDIRNEYRFSMWNKRAEDLWGLKREEVIGKNDYDFFPKEQADGFREKDLQTVEGGEMVMIPEEVVTSPLRGEVIVRTRKVIVRNGEGQPLLLLGISEDITEQKHSQDLIEQQRLQMVNTGKMTALGEMAGGIAHEINNPLAIIEIYASQLIALAESGRLDADRVTKASSVISATVDRIARITRGLRSFARDAENDPFVSTPVKQILDETLEFCHEKFSNSGVKLDFSVLPLDLQVECRPVQISQVLLNLMNNSYDAVLGTANAFVKVEAYGEGANIVISVIDSGHGISTNVADKIMQPFFTTKGVGKGTGLGLSISQGIIRSHQGSLELDPNSSNTRFVIAIPKHQRKLEEKRAK